MATNPVEAAGKDPTNPDDSSLPRENPIAAPGKISGLGAQLDRNISQFERQSAGLGVR